MNSPDICLPVWDSYLLVWSAESRAALRAILLAVDPDTTDLGGLAHQLAGLPLREHRYALVAGNAAELRRALDFALKRLESDSAPSFTQANSAWYGWSSAAPTAVLFPGFGAKPGALAADLRALFPCVERWFAGYPQLPAPPGDALGATLNGLLLNDLAMWALFSALGLRPAALLGHSYGENAVLHAAAMVEDPGAVLAIAARLAQGAPAAAASGKHGMLAVSAASRAVLDPLLVQPQPKVFVALDNCPQQTVVWGDAGALEELRQTINQRGEKAFELPGLTLPAHTPAFPLSPATLAAVYAAVAIHEPRLAAWSCASAAPFPADPAAIREVLVRQWHHPVRFRETVEKLAESGIRTFVELGTADFLSGFVRDTLRGSDAVAIATNREGRPVLRQVQLAVAQLVARGHDLDLGVFHEGAPVAGFSGAPIGGEGIAPALSVATAQESPSLPAAAEILALILAEMRSLLNLGENDVLDAEGGFFDLGMTSLGCVALLDNLAKRLDLALPQTLPFDYPTPARLARAIGGLHHPSVAPCPMLPRGASEEPIAIVGAGCRLPGGIDTPAGFWAALAEGCDKVSEVPASRWDVTALAPNDRPETRRRASFGGFLDDVKGFDAEFFGISPREALALDPQQRLLLELTWEALENACIAPSSLLDSPTGVFVGISSNDYAQRLSPRQRLDLGGYFATGNAASTAAGRIAFTLGAKGPCLAVDTACSSSLVAVHLACQSLRRGEVNVAVAAGVNLLLNGEISIFLARGQALSLSGRCRTFDAGADGYVRAEGGAALILKRLGDAQADGDTILAVIRGSAVNHDGCTSGLTVPNGLAQQEVIRQALADAHMSPAEIGVVEAHGTGTALGDPIEVQALAAVYGVKRGAPLLISSFKSNLGHLEAAAGITGLLKACLQLRQRALAPSLHVRHPNPRVDWARLPLSIVTAPRPWDETIPRAAGVSAFGIGGTNAHLLISEAPPPPVGDAAERPCQVLTLSAKTPQALEDLSGALAAHLSGVAEADFPALCRAANRGRSHFRERRAVAAASIAEARAHLSKKHRAAPSLYSPRIAFLFTGQGSQYPGMGRELYHSEPQFRAELERCAAIFEKHAGGKLLEVMFSDEPGQISQTRWTQPCLFAFEYALAQLWRSWGIEPAVVLGHSVGEYVAATLAGVFSLEDALRLVARRGELIQALPAGGGMLAVNAGEAALPGLLGDLWPRLSLAAVNAPHSSVVSGQLGDLQSAAQQLKEQGILCVPLEVSHAFHSHLLEPALAPFRAAALQVAYQPPRLPLLATLDGVWGDARMAGADYWCAQLRGAVRFGPALEKLLDEPHTVCLEIGPKSILTGMGGLNPKAGAARWVASLSGPGGENAALMQAVAALYEAGCDFDWTAFHAARPATRVAFPGYRFQREALWLDPPPANHGGDENATGSGIGGLLTPQPVPGDPRRHYANRYGLPNTHPLGGLKVNGQDILLASAPVTLALAAAARSGLSRINALEVAPLVADIAAGTLFHATLAPDGAGLLHIQSGDPESPWMRLAGFTASEEGASSLSGKGDGTPGDAAVPLLDGARFYDTLRNPGFEYTERHRFLDQLRIGPQSATAIIDINQRNFVSPTDFAVLLETGFQLFTVIHLQSGQPARFSVRSLRAAELRPLPPDTLILEASLQPDSAGYRAAIHIRAAATGTTVLALDGLILAAHPLANAPAIVDMAAGLRARPPAEQLAVTLKFLRKAVAVILLRNDAERLDTTQTLVRMGLDSLLALQLSVAVQRGFAVNVPVGYLIDQCNLDKLAAHIVASLEPTAQEPGAPAGLDYLEGEL